MTDMNLVQSIRPPQVQCQLDEVLNAAAVLFWETGTDDAIVRLSQEMGEELWQGQVDDFLATLHEDDRVRLRAQFIKARLSRKAFNFRCRLLGKNGMHRCVVGFGTPNFSLDGDFLGHAGGFVDLAGYEAANRRYDCSAASASRSSQARDVRTFCLSAEGAILYFPPYIGRRLGRNGSELTGKSLCDIAIPDDVSIIQAALQAVPVLDGIALPIQFRARCTGGEYIWIRLDLRTTKKPSGTAVVAILGVAELIVDRMASESDMKALKSKLDDFINLSSDWYWETDEDDRFTFISDGAQKLFGVPAKACLGKTRFDLLHDASQPGILEYKRRVARREPLRNIIYSCERGPDDRRSLSVSAEPVFVAGIFKGYRGIGRDITEEVAAANRFTRLAAENKALVDNSLDMMIVLDKSGYFLRVNSAVKELLGYEPEQMIGRHFLEFVFPLDQSSAMVLHAHKCVAAEKVRDVEIRWVCRNGSIAHLALSARWSAYDELVYATGRDVSERYRIRTELQKSRDKMVSIVESIGDAFFAIDRGWRATYVNRKTADFIGIDQSELIGKVVWEAVPYFRESPVFQFYWNAMESRRDAFFDTFYERTCAWVEVRIYAHEDGLSVFFHDVTARRNAELAIRESEARFRNVLEMTPAGYLLTDAKGSIVDVNPAFCGIVGYERDELIGMSILRRLPRRLRHILLSVPEKSDVIGAEEIVLRGKQGNLLYVLVNASIGRNTDGSVTGLTAFLVDITDRKQAETKLIKLANQDALKALPNRSHLDTCP